MDKDTGGAAFPKPKVMQQAVSFEHEEGMSLRDYFAAKAMQGILFECLEPQDTAKFAYEMADAMLKARK